MNGFTKLHYSLEVHKLVNSIPSKQLCYNKKLYHPGSLKKVSKLVTDILQLSVTAKTVNLIDINNCFLCYICFTTIDDLMDCIGFNLRLPENLTIDIIVTEYDFMKFSIM